MRRSLLDLPAAGENAQFCDVLIIGCGIAGLSCAIEAANAGRRVTLLNKGSIAESNTLWAQGGIAAATDPMPESIEAHVQDTLLAGDGLCDEAMVRQIIASGPDAVAFLRQSGCDFDLDEAGNPAIGHEAAHSLPRIIHAGGDATGAEVSRGLLARAQSTPGIELRENTFVIDLLVEEGRCCGVAVQQSGGQLAVIWASETVLASGGAGRLYRESSNPPVATGDGHAMAIRAGAVMQDLEMIQFHPTLLYVAGAPRTLLTEALRGAGAVLRNSAGDRFMERYDERLELAPRDIVARAISAEMRRTGDEAGFLDVTHLDQAMLRERFPGFSALCDKFGIDVARSWVPVRPGPHYMIGGIAADRSARTSIDGLYAIGEVASNGFHGANRLASNSLLEGVVVGRQLGCEFGAAQARVPVRAGLTGSSALPERELDWSDLRNTFRTQMLRHLGVERTGSGMEVLTQRLIKWIQLMDHTRLTHRKAWEYANMLHLATGMTASALFRRESRGVHFRSDFPNPDPALAQRHVSFRRDGGADWLASTGVSRK